MEKLIVMVAGLPGKMATLVAKAIATQEDMMLHTTGLSEESGCAIILSPFVPVELVPIASHKQVLSGSHCVDLIVDFTLPKSVNANARLYCEAGVPFVMGTTGGNREALVETVKNSKISAVIAANMAVPVVIFQEMIRFAAANFPHALDGFHLSIEESHQASKKDVSGTAVSLLPLFAELGMPLAKGDIRMIRDPELQEQYLGVPKEYLGGHGFHTYEMLSPDDTVELGFIHNVLGRNVYVDGAMRAIRLLAEHRQERGKVFSMADVLRGSKQA